MRRGLCGMAAALVLAGCIPQVERDYQSAHPRYPAPPRQAEPYPAMQEQPGGDDRPQPPQEEAPPPSYQPAPSQRAFDARVDQRPAVAARPVWEARPVTPTAQIVAGSTYDARPGDTLSRIAARTGAGAGAIAHANGLQPPFTIEAGQQLTIPGGRYHLVQPGEAGIAIARAYGVEWSRIVAANDLTEPFVLRAGERILIPGTPEGTNRLAERAAAFRLDIDDILTGGEPAPAPRQAPARPTSSAARVLPPTAVVAAPARLRGGFMWPVDGRIVKRFGPGASGERNDGIKIAVPLGTPIHAAADGVVAYVGDGIAALGGLVIVKHGDGWTSVYGHASKLLVQRGQAVKQGQTIALSGDTGYADRPEVHFELRKGRVPVDPTTQLPRR